MLVMAFFMMINPTRQALIFQGIGASLTYLERGIVVFPERYNVLG
jgi:hypothetical protein